MGLSRNKVAVSEGAAGSPPFYGEQAICQTAILRMYLKVENNKTKMTEILSKKEMEVCCSIFRDQKDL